MKPFLKRFFPNKTPADFHIPKVEKMNHPLAMTLTNVTEIIVCLLVLSWLIFSAWKYGYKEKQVHQSWTLIGFYVVGALNIMINITAASFAIKGNYVTTWYIELPEN